MEMTHKQFMNSRVCPVEPVGRGSSTQEKFVGYDELEVEELILHDIVRTVERPGSFSYGQILTFSGLPFVCAVLVDVHLLFPRKNRYSLGVVLLATIHIWICASCSTGGIFSLRVQASEQNMYDNNKSFLFLITVQESSKIG